MATTAGMPNGFGRPCGPRCRRDESSSGSPWSARDCCGFNIEVEGLELVPRGEPLIVAAAPHRNWIDPFLILQVLPPLPRTYFLAAADTPAIGGGNGS